MKSDDQQVDRYLCLLDEGVLTPREAQAQVCRELGDDSASLDLAYVLSEVALPADETAAARERVRMSVARALVAEQVATPHETSTTRETPDLRPVLTTDSIPVALPARRPPAPRQRALRLALAAAVLLVACGCGWSATTYASSALPGTPLYSVKRLDEQVALVTAWSDTRRVTVSFTIADHRLTEARAEADQKHYATARQLLAEFDNNVHQLIYLDALMTSQHANTTGVSTALNAIVDQEVNALTTAQQNGQTSFASALASSLTSENQVAHANAVALPASAQNAAAQQTGTPGNGTPTHSPTGSTGSTGPTGSTGTATPGPLHTAEPGQQALPSNGNGNGQGNTGSTGAHGGTGAPAHSTATPTPSPSPSATASATPHTSNGNGDGKGHGP